ncbi:MAG: hypothetical protein JWO25_1903 [Alphaproteobacteria bacterium]|nr:hypothetical protein [Alphaproteobacteria bacterium]MDB5722191.1 hypothetical protein [Alphaproteobacteria bacterium]
MSRDQRPAKVKVYSGAGAQPGAAVAAAGRRSRAIQPGVATGGAAIAAGAQSAATESGGMPWLIALLFVLGCAIGGGLFTFLLQL